MPLRAEILSSQKLSWVTPHNQKKCYFLKLFFLFIFILIIVILRRKNRIKTVYHYYINKKNPYKDTKTRRHLILTQLCLNIRTEIVKSLSVLNSVMVL